MIPTDHRTALEWAAAARARRTEVLDDLSASRLDLAGVLALAADDPLVGVVRVQRVLESVPGARKVDTRRALAALGLDGATPLAGLDPAGRRAVLDTFPLDPSPVGAPAGDQVLR